MERFLGGAFARFVLVPLLGVALANFARVLSRRGKGSGQEASRRLRPEDLAVGLDMTVLAIVSLLGLAVERIHAVVTSDSQLIKLLAHKPLDAGGQVKASHLAAISQSADADYASYLVAGFLFTILLFALAAAVERFGRDPKGELRTAMGIIGPAMLGALPLLVVWILAIRGGPT